MKRRIAYLVSRFPHLPETFILREMDEMERQGWEIGLFPLIHQKQAVAHAEAERWMRGAGLSPMLSAAILAGAARTAVTQPGKTLMILGQIIRGNLGTLRFLLRSLVLFPKILYLARIIERGGYGQIHAHYATYPALAAWAIHRLTGIPYSVTVHAHDIFESKPMLAEKIKDANLVVAISIFNRDYLVEYLGEWARGKTFVVPCGVRPEDYLPKTDFRRGPGRFEILTVGSLEPYKGQSYLVEAARILAGKRFPFRIRIIGMGWMKTSLQKMIDRYGLTDQVLLVGAKTQEEIARLLPEADCYVQPSVVMPEGTMEGIPVALMEAMVCGLPVVATRISGIPELVVDRVSGLLVGPGDAPALAGAIEWVAGHREAAAEMGNNGRGKVLREFNLHENVRQLNSLLESIRGQNPGQ